MAELVKVNSGPSLTQKVQGISNKILHAKQAEKYEVTEEEMRRQIGLVCISSGIKELPAGEVILLCLKFWLDKYAVRLSPKELQLAFELNLCGDLHQKVNHYQCFSVEFFCQVLNTYLETKAAVNIKLQQQQQPEPVALQKPDVKPHIIDDIIADYRAVHCPDQYTPTNAFALRYKLNTLATLVEIDLNEDLVANLREKARASILQQLSKQKNSIYNVQEKFGQVASLTHQIARLKSGKLLTDEDENRLQAETNYLLYLHTLKQYPPEEGEGVEICGFVRGLKLQV